MRVTSFCVRAGLLAATFALPALGATVSNYTTWARRMGGSSVVAGDATEIWRGIDNDRSGGVVVDGTFISADGDIQVNGSGAVEPLVRMGSGTDQDIVVARYDSNGNLMWRRTYGGAGTDVALANCTDSANNSYVVGTSTSPSLDFGTNPVTGRNFTLNGAGTFLLKLDPDGNTVWALQAAVRTAGVGQVNATECAVDSNDHVVISGGFGGVNGAGSEYRFGDISEPSRVSIPPLVGNQDGFVARYDPSGTLNLFQRTFAAASASARFRGLNIAADNDILVGGGITGQTLIKNGETVLDTLDSNGGRDILVGRIDAATGQWSWAFAYGGASDDEVRGMAAVGNDVAIGAYLESKNVAVKGEGTPQTTVSTLGREGSADLHLARFDPQGVLKWATTFGSTGNDGGTEIETRPDGNGIVFAGHFVGNVDFNGDGTADFLPQGGADFAVGLVNATTGTVTWVTSPAGGPTSDISYGVTASTTPGVYYYSGYFTNQATFGATTLTSKGWEPGGTTRDDAVLGKVINTAF